MGGRQKVAEESWNSEVPTQRKGGRNGEISKGQWTSKECCWQVTGLKLNSILQYSFLKICLWLTFHFIYIYTCIFLKAETLRLEKWKRKKYSSTRHQTLLVFRLWGHFNKRWTCYMVLHSATWCYIVLHGVRLSSDWLLWHILQRLAFSVVEPSAVTTALGFACPLGQEHYMYLSHLNGSVSPVVKWECLWVR